MEMIKQLYTNTQAYANKELFVTMPETMFVMLDKLCLYSKKMQQFANTTIYENIIYGVGFMIQMELKHRGN